MSSPDGWDRTSDRLLPTQECNHYTTPGRGRSRSSWLLVDDHREGLYYRALDIRPIGLYTRPTERQQGEDMYSIEDMRDAEWDYERDLILAEHEPDETDSPDDDQEEER